MPETLLARKSGPQDNRITTSDEQYAQLSNDPTVTQFHNQGEFRETNIFPDSTNVYSTYGSSSTRNFGSSGDFGSSTAPGTYNMNMSMGHQPILTGSGYNAAQGADVLVANDGKDWINNRWRPAMGWVYMATCTADFVIFPILWSILQAVSKGNVATQWQPLTLQGAGLYHIAMGAVLGIAAYGRTKEKIEAASK